MVIVDSENTGRLNFGSRWSYGLHEFVEVKHNLHPKDQSLTAASISHPSFFRHYTMIYGLTGTIGTMQERSEVQKIYNVDTIDIPPHLPSKRQRLPLAVVDNAIHMDKIADEVVKYCKLKRPVLILFKTI